MRRLRTALSLLLYFCAATLLAQVIILGYLWSTWQLDREKVLQMLAIAQGIDLFGARQEAELNLEQIPPQQDSYQDWVDRRATMFRDLELRELALRNALARIKSEQEQVARDYQASRQLIADFDARLLALTQDAEAEGRQTVGRILESIKPKQAKEQILQMLDQDEIDEVVLILRDMTETKRAKILGEFKTEEEGKKISEVLRLLREGDPTASMAEETLEQLPRNQAAGS